MKHRNIFDSDKTLKETYSKLMTELKSDSHVTIYGNGKSSLYIPGNGDNNWWFDDLVVTILTKVANGDAEILKICIENDIPLFDVKIKTPAAPDKK